MKLEQYFKGLADVTRLRVLNLLLHGELCGCEIRYVLDMSQPNVSRHLTYLKNCCLVLDRRDGPRIFYRLAEDRSGATKCLFDCLRQVFKGDELLQQDTSKLKGSIQAGSCTRNESGLLFRYSADRVESGRRLGNGALGVTSSSSDPKFTVS